MEARSPFPLSLFLRTMEWVGMKGDREKCIKTEAQLRFSQPQAGAVLKTQESEPWQTGSQYWLDSESRRPAGGRPVRWEFASHPYLTLQLQTACKHLASIKRSTLRKENSWSSHRSSENRRSAAVLSAVAWGVFLAVWGRAFKVLSCEGILLFKVARILFPEKYQKPMEVLKLSFTQQEKFLFHFYLFQTLCSPGWPLIHYKAPVAF